MSVPDEQRARSNRIKFVLLVALFLLPPVSAWLVWKTMGEDGSSSTTNAGTLVSPARPLAISGLTTPSGDEFGESDLRGRWTYVVFASSGCDQRCEEQLYMTRQIRLSMNKDIRRVQRVLVLDTAPTADLVNKLESEHADLRLAVSGTRAAQLLKDFRGEGFAPGGGQYFLVDPLGNLMMYYDLDVPPRGMMKDLQKLLKISQIG